MDVEPKRRGTPLEARSPNTHRLASQPPTTTIIPHPLPFSSPRSRASPSLSLVTMPVFPGFSPLAGRHAVALEGGTGAFGDLGFATQDIPEMPENRSETTYRRPASDVFPPAVALTRRLDTFSMAPSALPGRVSRPSHLLKISKKPAAPRRGGPLLPIPHSISPDLMLFNFRFVAPTTISQSAHRSHFGALPHSQNLEKFAAARRWGEDTLFRFEGA
ncbi:hypothetical protein C8R43DRAFT_1147453 [Mycena crocata]|nr:hypothetical protein C8R43DRAFT_1147453 [Mycena crocata]